MSRFARFALLPSLMFAALLANQTLGQTTTWVGGGGNSNWSNASNWSNGVPDATFDVVVPGGFTPSLDQNGIIGGLDLGATSQFSFNSGRTLTIVDGSLVNNGAIQFGFTSSAAGSLLFDTVNAVISGSGEIDISGAQSSDNMDSLGGVMVTNGNAHTIRGSGFIQALLTNEGIIDADNNGLQMVLSDKAKTNNGTMRATGGGILNISGVNVQNGGGELLSSGGTVRVGDGAVILGGMIGGSDLDFVNATLNNVQISTGANGQLNSGTTLTIGGTSITNDGTVQFGVTSSASGTVFATNSLALNGIGEFDISGAQSNDNLDSAAGAVITQGSNHTIRGSGFVQAGLVNNGNVVADNNGLTLVLNDKDKTNNNQFSATDGGILRLEAMTLDNTAGTIVADNGTVDLAGVQLNGGDLESITGSSIRVVGSSALENVSLTTSDTLMTINSGQVATFQGTSLVNNGSVQFGFTSAATGTVVFDGNVALNGNGEFDIAGAQTSDNVDTTAGSMVTQGSNHTIRGSGYIQASMVNNGTISADNNGLTLVLDTNDKTNNNVMNADQGGILRLEGITIQNGAGSVRADVGFVDLVDATVVGGDLESSAGSSIRVVGDSTLENVSLPTADTTVTVNSGQTATIQGSSLLNNGSVQFGFSTAATGVVQFEGNVALNGTGEFDISGAQTSDRLDTGVGSTVTQAAGHTIRGSGFVRAALINNGTVSADNNGLTLVLDDKDKTNNGLMNAVGGGTLQISGIQVDNTNGNIEANGGTVRLTDDVVIEGGQVRSAGNNTIQSGNSRLNSVLLANASVLNIESSGVLSVGGSGLTNNGTINLGFTSAASGVLAFDTTGSVDGSGVIDIGGAQPSDSVYVTTGNTMDQAASHSIVGSGFIFGAINNHGQISADNNGLSLVIDPDGAPSMSGDPNATFANAGVMRAVAGSTLRFDGNNLGQFSNTGTIEALGGTVTSTTAQFQQLSTSTVTDGTYRAINGTIDIAPVGYQAQINDAVIETVGASASNDVLGIKSGPVHLNNALVQNNGTILLGDGANLTLTAVAEGGNALVSTGELVVGNASTLDATDRTTTFTIPNDTTDAGVFVDGGTLRGSGTITGGVYMPSGTLSPGDADAAAGLLSIDGDFNMDDPNLLVEEALTVIELGGYARGTEYDSFDATGDFFGQGELRATLINGFLPNVGDEFVIATYVEDGNVPGNLWDNYTFNRVQFSLVDRSLGGNARETVMTVLDIRDIDFSGDSNFDCADVDALVAEIVAGTNAPQFDLNFDGVVDGDDLSIWLTDAGAANLSSGEAYLPADATLDGIVDAADFIVWNANKFTNNPSFCSGDFTADGVVDAQDFIIWNDVKFTSSGIITVNAVPEPNCIPLFGWIVALAVAKLRRKS